MRDYATLMASHPAMFQGAISNFKQGLVWVLLVVLIKRVFMSLMQVIIIFHEGRFKFFFWIFFFFEEVLMCVVEVIEVFGGIFYLLVEGSRVFRQDCFHVPGGNYKGFPLKVFSSFI